MIAIIAILLAMLLPAIQSSRESARRTACMNKLKQVGIALADYESATGAFPPGILASAWRSGKEDQGSTALTGRIASFGFFQWTYFLHELMPRLDEQRYYDGLRGPLFRVPWLSNVGSTDEAKVLYNKVDGIAVQPLLCPSDTQTSALWATPRLGSVPLGAFRLAKSNYLGFFSGTNVGESLSYPHQNPVATNEWSNKPVHPLPPRGAFAPAPDRRAVFGFGRGTPMRAIRDGIGNTMAVAEYLRGFREADGRGAFWSNDPGMQMLHACGIPNDHAADRLRSSPRSDAATHDWGCFRFGSFVSPNHQPGLNLPCVMSGLSDDAMATDGFATPRSRHPQGVNVLFCDGRVQFIEDRIDSDRSSPYGTWQRLAWIDDGQQVTPP